MFFLRAISLFAVEDHDHLARLRVLRVNGGLAGHLDHFAKLVLRLPSVSLQGRSVLLQVARRDPFLRLQHGGRARVVRLLSAFEGLEDLLAAA